MGKQCGLIAKSTWCCGDVVCCADVCRQWSKHIGGEMQRNGCCGVACVRRRQTNQSLTKFIHNAVLSHAQKAGNFDKALGAPYQCCGQVGSKMHCIVVQAV